MMFQQCHSHLMQQGRLRVPRLKRLRCPLWDLSLSRHPNLWALAEGNLSWYRESGFPECLWFHPRLTRLCKGQYTAITESMIRHALAITLLQHNQLLSRLCQFTCNWPFPQNQPSQRPASLVRVRHQLYLFRVLKICCCHHQGWCCRWEFRSDCSKKCAKSCLMHWRHH